MRLTIFQVFFVAFFSTLSFAHPSQGQEILSRKISINSESTELKKILHEIEKQANVKFVFSANAIQVNQKITLLVSNTKLQNILDEILGNNGIEYEVLDDRIILKKKNVERLLLPNVQNFSPKTSAEVAEEPIKGKISDKSGATIRCLLYGAYFYMSWMPKYLQNGRGIPKSDLGWMVSLPFVLGMAGCLIGGFASDDFSKKRGLTFGRRYVGMFGLVMAGICMLAGSYIENTNLSIISFGLGLAFKDSTLPVAWSAATDIGGKFAGSVSGTMGLAGQMGSVVMASAFGFILTATGSYEIPVRIIGVVVIIGGFLWFKIDASKPILTEE